MTYNPIGNYPHLGAQQGWQCPKCGKVNAPWMMQCPCPASPPPYPGIGTPWVAPLTPYNPYPYVPSIYPYTLGDVPTPVGSVGPVQLNEGEEGYNGMG